MKVWDSLEHKQSLLYMFFFHVAIDLFASIKTRPADFATSADSKISGFARPHGSKLFALQRADSKSCGFACEFAGYVWTEGESGKKKLRIQKYPDTCGRTLRVTKNIAQRQNSRTEKHKKAKVSFALEITIVTLSSLHTFISVFLTKC